jgi:hypothetical protein
MRYKITSLIVLAGLSVPGTVSNAEAGECSAASLRGTYAFYTTATIVPAGTPRVNVAVLTFDGKGSYFSRYTTNDNGTVSRGTLLDLTYEVNADCTGSTFDSAGQDVGDLVLIDGGREFYFIRTNPAGWVLYGVGKKQFSE